MALSFEDKLAEEMYQWLEDGDASPFQSLRVFVKSRGPYLQAFVQGHEFPPYEIEIQMSSRCNLRCRWCIGDEVQSQRRVQELSNSIEDSNVDQMVNGILDCRLGGLSIRAIKFSGFIGEPLLKQRVTLHAIRCFAGAGRRVGLFTNGVLMGEETWETLASIDYVHVSLDAGPMTFCLLKQPNMTYSDAFETVLSNIRGLAGVRARRRNRSRLRINIGYVVVPGNFKEIQEVTRLVQEAGADSIRFKCDIGGKHDLARAGLVDDAYEQIEEVKAAYAHSASFKVHVVHEKNDVISRRYKGWDCSKGCLFHHFLATIGSDGNVYLCDHNTMPGAIPLGLAIEDTFERIWASDRRRYLTDGVPYTCQCGVCPPFATRLNPFLQYLSDLRKEYGGAIVAAALERLQGQL